MTEDADILLVALNARYTHASFGLRYLLANLGELQSRAALLERTINDDPIRVVEEIVDRRPTIVGLGVYIWNVDIARIVVDTLRAVAPEIVVVLGGPEVSHELEDQPWTAAAHVVITGEADHAFRELCVDVLDPDRRTAALAQRVRHAPPPAPHSLALPYALYSDEDLAHRVLYVEASRGCPFRCEFCLSSLDRSVRAFDLDRFLAAMDALFERGARHFKFVDRTFNLKPATTSQILDFFLDRLVPGLFLHFEMIPDHLPAAVRERIVRFPLGTVQFEVGIQTFDPEVAARISRRQNYAKLHENLSFLRDRATVHVHADLIVGLPGESLASIRNGFDTLWALAPAEIQVGVLKRLRGTPIVRHTDPYGMVYSPSPPYEVLQTSTLDFATLQRLKRFATFVDKLANSGNFAATLALWFGLEPSPFDALLGISDRLFARLGRSHSIALRKLSRLVYDDLTEAVGLAPDAVALALAADWLRPGRRDLPPFLEPWRERAKATTGPAPATEAALPRQNRHAAAALADAAE